MFDWKLRDLAIILENSLVVLSIRNGLMRVIPVLMIGSFALIFISLPIPAYQIWIRESFDGIIYLLFSVIHRTTFGVLSVCLTLSISLCYAKSYQKDLP